ncbi:efflux RND transporter periplasmic adaptor subunit [Shimia aestuarii]|uniref:efflux RND transporter periplasmic adaptor subunit n=1 Tax=Shimia aestuarii TaxID=254406 RepID=UPI001FB4DFF0|nr:efflux RND transporter periplasmic adaptor subunit [Shimia aestuarii]
MRPIPILTAILVTLFLFYVVVERDTLLALAAASPDEQSDNSAPTPAKDAEKPARLRVVALASEAKTISSAVILRGQTEADRQVDVRAETSAQVISEPLARGSTVAAGDVLCRLDPGTREATLAEAKARLLEARARKPETEARLDEAKSKLDEAMINFNAASKLAEDGFASEARVASTQAAVRSAQAGVAAAQSGLQSTQAGVESAEAAVASASREIKRLTITAPFDGLLESDTAELGSLLQPGSLCATVIRLDPIRVVGFVPETEVGRVMLGAPAGARLTTGQEITGTVSFLSRSADPATRTFRVEINVPNPDLEIRDGQTAEIVIGAEGTKAHLVPQSALTLNDDGTLGVRTVDADGIVGFSEVDILRDTTEGLWLSGLPETANIITIGQEFVVRGVKVEPVFDQEEPAQ